MDDAVMGWIVLIAICTISAFIAHKQIKSHMWAIATSVLASVILFQIAVYIQQGYLDPFFIIAIFISAFVSFFVSLIIGRAMGKGNRKNTFSDMRRDIDEAK
jgi:ABC-type Mn2+/Zn2+ transport system permease subunit